MISTENNINNAPATPPATDEDEAGLLYLFLCFLTAGGLTPGGGYATIAPLRRALVEKHRWISAEEYNRALVIVQAMPGIFNVNLASYLGHKIAGWKGCAAALAGMVFPPMVLFAVFATFYDTFCSFPAIESFLRGARPAIIALVALPCVQMWRRSSITLSTVWIPVGAAIAIGLLGISPSYIVIGFIVLGILYGVFVHNK